MDYYRVLLASSSSLTTEESRKKSPVTPPIELKGIGDEPNAEVIASQRRKSACAFKRCFQVEKRDEHDRFVHIGIGMPVNIKD